MPPSTGGRPAPPQSPTRPPRVIGFLYDLLQEYSNILDNLGGIEERYGMTMGSLNEVLQGESLRAIAEDLPPEVFGNLLKLLIRVQGTLGKVTTDLNKLSGQEKRHISSNLRSMLKDFETLKRWEEGR